MQENIDGSLGLLLTKGTQSLHRQLNRNFASSGHDITSGQWSVLIFLHKCGANSQHEIAEKTFRDKVSVTKIIDNLEKRELVFRVPDEKDRRIKRIFLTDNGKSLVPKLGKAAFNTLQEGFSNIDKRDIESFKKVLSEIIKNFTGEDLLEFINKNKGRWK